MKDGGFCALSAVLAAALLVPAPATVRQRAIYLTKQLALPEDQRVLQIPEKDAEQRIYKPY